MSSRTHKNKTQKGHGNNPAGDSAQTAPLEIHEPSFGTAKRANKASSAAREMTAEEPRPVSAPAPVAAAPAPQGSVQRAGPTLEERFVWTLAFLVGRLVTVRTRDGRTHEGVLHTAQRGGARGVSVLLRTVGPQGAVETLAIDAADFVDLAARDVREGAEEGAPRPTAAAAPGFATDTEISGAQGARAAEALEVWDFSVDDESLTERDRALLDCDLSGAGGATEWDQYRVNKERFGIETTYSPDFYTPHVDRTSAAYARAQREEREIMATETTNVHRLGDRGVDIGDRLTEEELYGGVIRDKKAFAATAAAAAARPLSSETIATASAKEKEGKYIPPRMREAVARWQRDEKEAEKKDPGMESFPEKQEGATAAAAAAVPTEAEKEVEKAGREQPEQPKPTEEKTEAPVEAAPKEPVSEETAPAPKEKTAFSMSAPSFAVCPPLPSVLFPSHLKHHLLCTPHTDERQTVCAGHAAARSTEHGGGDRGWAAEKQRGEPTPPRARRVWSAQQRRGSTGQRHGVLPTAGAVCVRGPAVCAAAAAGGSGLPHALWPADHEPDGQGRLVPSLVTRTSSPFPCPSTSCSLSPLFFFHTSHTTKRKIYFQSQTQRTATLEGSHICRVGLFFFFHFFPLSFPFCFSED